MTTYTPFTYCITFIPTGEKYYGSRYGKGCHPDTLWTSYFTSSKVIQQLILEHGKDAFVVSIRKTFNTAKEARKWETTFLNKVEAAQSNEWLNQHNGDEKFYGRGHQGNRGRKLSAEHRKNIGDGQRGQKRGPPSIETIKKMSDAALGRKWTIETRLKIHLSRIGETRTLILVTCPHCGKSGKGGNMTRYHFDNCPKRP